MVQKIIRFYVGMSMANMHHRRWCNISEIKVQTEV